MNLEEIKPLPNNNRIKHPCLSFRVTPQTITCRICQNLYETMDLKKGDKVRFTKDKDNGDYFIYKADIGYYIKPNGQVNNRGILEAILVDLSIDKSVRFKVSETPTIHNTIKYFKIETKNQIYEGSRSKDKKA